MTPMTIIEKANAEGLVLMLAPTGKVRLRGPEHLVARWLPVVREQKAAIAAVLGDCLMTHAEIMENVQEAIEERSAIQEYDGGLSRERAETAAKAAMKVYEYRLTDGPRWLVMLAPGCDLAKAEHSLRDKFGDRFVDVREWRATA